MTKIDDQLVKQRIYVDKLSKKLGMSFLPIMKKKEFIGYLLGVKKIIPVECKIRSNTSTTYDSTLIEQKMVQKLKKGMTNKQFSTVYYVEVFSDNKAIVYDLSLIGFEWSTEECKANTFDSSKKENKTIAMIPYNKGTLVDLTVERVQPEPIIYKEDIKNYHNLESIKLF